MQIKNGIVSGVLRVLNKLIAKDVSADTVTATTFTGNLVGNASSATKLGASNVGGTTTPIYLNGGTPTALNYTIAKSVPSDAKFTDTNTWRGIQDNLTSTSTTDSLSANQGKVLKGLVDGKADSGHTHSYAGSSSAGGSATSAVKLDTATAGSVSQPVYFTGGKPTAISYTIAKSIPSDAKFTDTTYSDATTSASGLMSSTDKTKLNGIASNANNYSHPTTAGNKHIPSGGQSGQFLKWSADGTAVWANDNNTTYSNVTTTANGLMSYTDKVKLNGIAEGANKTVVDTVLSSTSINPISNSAVNTKFNEVTARIDVALVSDVKSYLSI